MSESYVAKSYDEVRRNLFANGSPQRLFSPPSPEAGQEDYLRRLAEYHRCCMYRDLFTTTAGEEVLQDLYQQHVLKTQFNPDEPNPAEHGFFREGCKAVVLELADMIRRANGPPPEQPQQPEEDFRS